MTLPTDLAIAILTRLEADGYLEKGARFKDASLLPTVAGTIGAYMGEVREEFAKFCIWWADIGHKEHDRKMTFWKCDRPMCKSLVETIADLSRQLETTPDALAPLPQRS